MSSPFEKQPQILRAPAACRSDTTKRPFAHVDDMCKVWTSPVSMVASTTTGTSTSVAASTGSNGAADVWCPTAE